MKKSSRSWRLTGDSHQLNSVVAPIVLAVSNIVTITEYTAQANDTWDTVLDIAYAFFSTPLEVEDTSMGLLCSYTSCWV